MSIFAVSLGVYLFGVKHLNLPISRQFFRIGARRP